MIGMEAYFSLPSPSLLSLPLSSPPLLSVPHPPRLPVLSSALLFSHAAMGLWMAIGGHAGSLAAITNVLCWGCLPLYKAVGLTIKERDRGLGIWLTCLPRAQDLVIQACRKVLVVSLSHPFVKDLHKPCNQLQTISPPNIKA